MQRGTIVEEAGNGTLEVFPLPVGQDFLLGLLTDIFENHWHEIHFGPAIQGAVWEIRAPCAPERIGVLDGYLTVDFGHWHFHVCIGDYKGPRARPAPPELTAHRRTARAELYRHLREDGRPSSWGLRLFNGAGEQQMTVFLPNPWLTIEQKILKEPDFSHLAMWDKLRQTYLGLPPDPLDRDPSRKLCGG